MAILSAGVVVALLSLSQVPAETPLKPGDRIRIVVTGAQEYNGEYAVLDDGSVTGVGFGRLIVQGKGVTQVRSMVREELKKVLVNPAVSVVIVEQKLQFVFVTSVLQGTSGPLPFQPGMDVRTALTGVIVPSQTDLYAVRLFRKGVMVQTASLKEVLEGAGTLGSSSLLPDDVLTISEATKLRIYVSGRAANPGAYQVLEGTDAIQAVAIAGGSIELNLAETEAVIKVRRGEAVTVVEQGPEAPRFLLESGDTVFVEVPDPMRVFIGGEVRTPQELSLREGSGLLSALQKSGGLISTGSLKNILVIRGPESYVVDLSFIHDSTSGQDFALRDRDIVFVQRNDRRLYVLGFAARPGTIIMQENREYRLADAIAESGGLGARGSYVHIYVGRAGADGKVQVTPYRLDRFLKDGDLTQNPILKPGDAIMVGQPQGLSLQGVAQIISNTLLLNNLFGN